MKIRKSLTIVSLTLLTSTAFANDVKVKLNGKLDFQAGFSDHSDKGAAPTSIVNKDFALNNTTNFAADASNSLDSGITYGAKISLHTATRNNRSASSHLYITSAAGKIELGSDKSVYNKMRISSFSNATATGGGFDVWLKNNANIGYAATWSNYLDGKIRPAGNLNNAEFARKVSYYTPKMYNFQFGISYIPDTQNRGFRSFNDTSNVDAKVVKIHFKDAMALGATYENKFANDLKLRTAIVYEKGKTIQARSDKSKRSNLKTYTIGAEIGYKDFSVATAFSNYLKSATLASEPFRNTKAYGITGRYNYSAKSASSISYYNSDAQGNKFSSITLATQYKIMPGLLPYAEITLYKTKGKYNSTLGKPSYGTILSTPNKHKGSLVLIGAKLEF